MENLSVIHPERTIFELLLHNSKFSCGELTQIKELSPFIYHVVQELFVKQPKVFLNEKMCNLFSGLMLYAQYLEMMFVEFDQDLAKEELDLGDVIFLKNTTQLTIKGIVYCEKLLETLAITQGHSIENLFDLIQQRTYTTATRDVLWAVLLCIRHIRKKQVPSY